MRKALYILIVHPNATSDAFPTHVTSREVIYTISSELIPNTNTNQNTKLHSLEQLIKDFTTLFKQQQVNQVIQCGCFSEYANDKLRIRTEFDEILFKLPKKWTHPHVL